MYKTDEYAYDEVECISCGNTVNQPYSDDDCVEFDCPECGYVIEPCGYDDEFPREENE